MTRQLSPWQQQMDDYLSQVPQQPNPYNIRKTVITLPRHLEPWCAEHGARWEPRVRVTEGEDLRIIYSIWELPHLTEDTTVFFGRAMIWYSGYHFRYLGHSRADAFATLGVWRDEITVRLVAQLRTMHAENTKTTTTTMIQGSFFV